MKNASLLLITLVFSFGCNEPKQNDIATRPQLLVESTFKREIPTEGYSFKSDKIKEKLLGLPNLESGFDSIQIRLWVDYALYKGRELYVIKNQYGKWTAEVYKMFVERDAAAETEEIISKQVFSVTPKIGWEDLIDSLLILRIETLPTMHDIPGLVDGWDDGVDYNIEFATNYRYKYYGYHLPEEFQDKFWQAKNMTQIVKLIRSQLTP
jgi:hypothetical protein